jgi:YbbR domain-containing protein
MEFSFLPYLYSRLKNKNFHIAIISTLFAAALWISVNMGNQYQTDISVPLLLENIKPNRALAHPVPQTVTVKIQTSGWMLVELYFVPDARYAIDLADVISRLSVITNNEISERLKLPESVRALEVKPDTITIVLDEKIKKNVPLEPVVQLSFREGYGVVGDIISVPDTISLTGARSLLDRIDRWQTQLRSFTSLKSDLHVRVPVSDTLAYGVTPFPLTVDLQADVQQIAEKSLYSIPVEVDQVPGNRVVVLIPPKIDIIVRGGIQQIAAMDAKDFSAYIDYRSILLDTTGSIQPVVVLPKNLRIVRQDPERLQYVVRK